MQEIAENIMTYLDFLSNHENLLLNESKELEFAEIKHLLYV